MNIIKLDAIGSTNTYLKELLVQSNLPNLSVVVAQRQLNGRGQRGAKWAVSDSSSLTFSVLVKDVLRDVGQIFDLNVAVALSVQQALESQMELSFHIKWPNDILSANKKIGGILIENSIKTVNDVQSIVGIGINVNQEDMSDLPKASSLRLLKGIECDKEKIFVDILNFLQGNLDLIQKGESNLLWDQYHKKLFRKDMVSSFQDSNAENFNGIIKGVTRYGNLQVLTDNQELREFGIKEIKLLY
ncbi:biotin--[acetyl-CoA-carboxylase] ligase [Myroides sp. LJL119]